MRFPQQLIARTRPDPVSLDKATMLLLKYLETNRADIAHALFLMRSRPMHCSAKDFVHKAAEYCISRVFDGKMSGIVIGVFAGMSMEISGRTYAPGVKGVEVCVYINGFYVNLYTARPSANGRDHLIALILHHLIHAYFLILCGKPIAGSKDADLILAHGKHFAAILYKLKQVSASVGVPLPLGFRHFRPMGGQMFGGRDGLDPFFDGRLRAPQLGEEKHACSYCTADVEEITETTIQTWIDKECRKSVDPDIYELGRDGEFTSKPQSKCGDAKDYVVFKWSKKLYRLPRSCLNNVPGLKSHFKDTKTQVEIREHFNETILKVFLKFVKTGDYGQPLAATRVKDGKCPPLIMEYKPVPTWPAFLVTDIEMFKLGEDLGLDELRHLALSRMNEQHITHEDPRAVLDALVSYPNPHTNYPSPPLVDWACAWFRRLGSVKIATKPRDASNWLLIDKALHSSLHRGTLARSPVLAAELTRAADELAALPVKAPGPPPPVSELFAPHVWHQHTAYGLPPPPPPQGMYPGAPPAFLPHLPPPPHMMMAPEPPGWEWGPVVKIADKTWEAVVPGTGVRAVWRDGKWMAAAAMGPGPMGMGVGQMGGQMGVGQMGAGWGAPGLPPPPPLGW